MYKIKVGEKEYDVQPQPHDHTAGTLNGKEYRLDLVKERNGMHLLKDDQSFRISYIDMDYETKTFSLQVNGNTYTVEAKDRFDLLLEELGMEDLASSAVNDLKAPMPGLVLSLEVKAGDTVSKGDALVVLEAMKMENVLKAASDAVVKNITVEVGKAVEKNQVLIEFE
ncbi:MAG TPA: acetyl-CoA carboxylase biotin carboxyl carrier protein subunit [Cryomorphaceae bacterium]|nr:acetyl-CoA carboxylase biotin carboxyl carrier protein subunit [Owenweeksia sp.]MBF97619.1 acetyl-CoA carboxylase biotin carboxyl carrier protein subunit [Owenweeksia sp.]HAD95936.1 acetyl-CoA carboxylase biotin carboxyl carrier protein subunit [Cryomorphaceae bacterium]HBF20528.1 acetyl-CoA carboxylase biotin carboxyl carrier protein subunit [Cryomorphaceae bacterium]HCQ14832.1 acetyl-CoA carboxylase biotin carboxyl carrier protein subunit [Cryomorphaceae bacterium]|tara:strand:- start:83 stop:586 length:504 start_codon:yes stop_codon:yes gene_type:complete